jgi:hypothetical protein
MEKTIVYRDEEGKVVVLIPSLEFLETHTLEDAAAKDVPPGVPYKIVDRSLFPPDRFFRDAWELDDVNPDGFGADYGVGSRNAVVGWNADGTPIIEERGND